MAGSSRKLNVEVSLSGEKQYKQAISELNASNKTLKAEMSRLQTEYEDSAKSSEFLTKKSEILSDMLMRQQEKIKTLKDAVAYAGQEYGESSVKTQNYATALAKAQEEEIKLQRALDGANEELEEATRREEEFGDAMEEVADSTEETTEALEDQGNTTKGLGDVVQNLANKFGVKLPEGTAKALNGMKTFSAGTVAALGAAAAGLTILIEGTKKLFELTKEYAAYADELQTEAMRTGVDVVKQQQMAYAAAFVDVDPETITSSWVKLTNVMSDAQAGSEKATEAFKKLHVEYKNADGSLRSAEDVFYDVVDALGSMENATERNALANDILGKSYQDINPLVVQGTDTLKAYMEEANNVYVLTEDQIAVLAKEDDAIQKNKLEWEGLKKQIAVQAAPAMTEAIRTFGDIVQKAGKMLVETKLVENFGLLLETALNLGKSFGDFMENLPGWMNPIQQLSNAFQGLAIILGTITDALNLIRGLAPWNWGSGMAKTALGWNATNGQYSATQKALGYGSMDGNYYDPTTGLYSGNYGRNAAGTNDWRGGLTWVGEAGPELVSLPRGSQIFNAQESAQAAGGDSYYFNVDVHDLQDLQALIMWAKTVKTTARTR